MNWMSDLGSYVTTENNKLWRIEARVVYGIMVLRFRPTIRVVPQIYRK